MINAEAVAEAEALIYHELIAPEYDMREDKNTKQRHVSVYTEFAMDHYGAEPYMVGFRGTA